MSEFLVLDSSINLLCLQIVIFFVNITRGMQCYCIADLILCCRQTRVKTT